MYTIIVLIFVLGYAAIIFEHQIHINKTASALITGVLCWTAYILMSPEADFFAREAFVSFQQAHPLLTGQELYADFVVHELVHHLGDIAQILFFLLGAMTIVELVDAHQGFKIVTDLIKTRESRKLLWVVSIITFFLSALLDNLTTAIVMISLVRKLIKDDEQRKMYAGMIIIAANAGGAWSPIGDVTTTMLWIGGYITTAKIMLSVFLPSLICLMVPLVVLSLRMGSQQLEVPAMSQEALDDLKGETDRERNIMFFVGVGGLVAVPVFKTLTHLPPYMGMLLSLGVVWLVSEILHKDKDEADKKQYSAAHALSKIDAPSVLFFFGILMAISALESLHLLEALAHWMDNTIGNLDVIVLAIGIGSAIIDNVPLVAASMGMYDLASYPVDHKLWEFMAYCAGTGGSILIIGSAAGVAVMGMEKIDFVWYLKKISLLALIGYLAGAAVYLGMYAIMAH